MKSKCCHFVCLLAWLFLFCADSGSSEGNQTNVIKCIAEERDALLQFKHGIKVDPCGLLSSWVGQECCRWHGIRCSNHSGHISSLDVSGYLYSERNPNSLCLVGIVSPSLVELKHLNYLDLSYNDFSNQPIPSFIGSILNLKYLNLSYANFFGEIPHQLANLSSLTSLDLSHNFDGYQGLNVKNLRWLSYLTLLTDINLSWVDLSLATDWMQTVNNLPLLKTLHMDECFLSMKSSFPLLKYTNSSSTLHTLSLQDNYWNNTRILEWVSNLTRTSSLFSYLDLSFNRFSGSTPSSLGNIHSPLHLDLSFNRFEGPIPETISNLKNLVHLNLSENWFEGPIPETISNLKHLTHLDLSYNNFQGSKWNPEVLGSLCNLQMLSLDGNNITNELSTIIQPLSQCVHKSLVTLRLYNNQLWGSLPDEIGAFFLLRELYLYYNQLNGTISPTLGQLSMLETLALSSNSLKGTVSNQHLSNLSRLTFLGLSNNPELVLNISVNWVPPFQLSFIHLRSCKMGPYFPKWLLTQTNFSELDISNASISDAIPTLFWNSLTPNLAYMNLSINMIHGNIPDVPISFHEYPLIDLSSNSFHGGIPSFLINASLLFLNDNCFSSLAPFFCPKTKVLLSTLRLSNNKLSGELPSCWGYFDGLTSLYFHSNNISGKIPETIGTLAMLEALHLRNNSISGELPMALESCTRLIILDLSHNSLTGHIPNWKGNNFPRLAILNLRNNTFVGGIPSSLCQISTLHVFDLSNNHLCGFIPKCIGDFTEMTNNSFQNSYRAITIGVSNNHSIGHYYYDSALIMWKRKEWMLKNYLLQYITIDMSNNRLEGPIPDGIFSLTGLKSLDLSRNRLSGNIAQKIGQLTSLEFLDLSRNKLSGEIPSSLGTVSSLGTLDVSYNNLSGQIPLGTQLQGFNTSSYTGNPGLCGEPLLKCPKDSTPTTSPNEVDSRHKNDGDYNIFQGLYISVVLGFIIGFWGVCGTLVIKTSWRCAFFGFFYDIKDKLHVLVVVSLARIRWRMNKNVNG